MADGDEVTLAVLATRLEYVQTAIDEMRTSHSSDMAQTQQEIRNLSLQIVQTTNDALTRVQKLEREESATGVWKNEHEKAHDKAWEAHKHEHAKENRIIVALSGIGNVLAGVIGSLFGTQP